MNGQVWGREWPIIDEGNGDSIVALSPERDSLESGFNSSHATGGGHAVGLPSAWRGRRVLAGLFVPEPERVCVVHDLREPRVAHPMHGLLPAGSGQGRFRNWHCRACAAIAPYVSHGQIQCSGRIRAHVVDGDACICISLPAAGGAPESVVLTFCHNARLDLIKNTRRVFRVSEKPSGDLLSINHMLMLNLLRRFRRGLCEVNDAFRAAASSVFAVDFRNEPVHLRENYAL